MSKGSSSHTPAHGSPVTLRTVFPQASRVERPESPIVRIAFAASSSGTWWNWKFCRVVMWPLRSGVYVSARSANASICSGVTPPKGSFTRIICTSGWRCPYTPCLRRKPMNFSSAISPWRNFLASVSKSSNSRSRMGRTCPGTSSYTSGFSSEPTLPLPGCFLPVSCSSSGGSGFGFSSVSGLGSTETGSMRKRPPRGSPTIACEETSKSRLRLSSFRRVSPARSHSHDWQPCSLAPDSAAGGFVAYRRMRLIDVGALDKERDPDVGPELVQVLAADARAHDVHRTDVAQRCLSLLQRLLGGVVGGRLRASDQLDDLDNGQRLLLWWNFGAGVLSGIAARRQARLPRAALPRESEARPGLDALADRRALPRAPLPGERRRRGSGLRQEALDRGGNRGRLLVRRRRRDQADSGPGRAALSVAAHA